jgi:hypothetical protein
MPTASSSRTGAAHAGLVALIAAGSARAQAPGADLEAAVMRPAAETGPEVAPSVAIRLPDPYAEAYARKTEGVAKTAVDARLDEGVTGAFGFLCGLKPGADRSGAAGARGVDPTGRFVGAKLSLAFR